ncbi:MAG: hypothetical protein ACTSVV_03415 [Promethearchaeota archaeon]
MKTLKDLNNFEKDVLLAICDANNFSTTSHVPIEAIMRRINRPQLKYFKKTFKTLLTNGFVQKHPVGRSRVTFNLTTKGKKAGMKISEQYKYIFNRKLDDEEF